MASKTEIANRALSKLGQPRVSNIDTTDTKAARTIRNMWDNVRDSLLQSFPWNFSVRRAQLAADGSAPAWGWAKQYTLPSDFLSLIEIKNNPRYEVADGFIMTDEGAPLYIKYVRRVVNTGLYDAMFAEAFAAQLAVEACEEITQSNTKKQILIAERDGIIKMAYQNDSIQNPVAEPLVDEWLTAREASFIDEAIDYNAG